MKSIVVYCGASPGKKPVYAEAAYELGKKLAQRESCVIYGGGNLGLMGKVADGAMEAGGKVIGIIPNFIAKLEVAHRSLTELHFVETMHERKAKMVAMSDGVIALPGGYGTMDEFFEILTWAQLKIFHGPVGLLNVNGFYDFLLAHLDKMVTEGFLNSANRANLVVASTTDSLLDQMESYQGTSENKYLDGSLYLEDPSN